MDKNQPQLPLESSATARTTRLNPGEGQLERRSEALRRARRLAQPSLPLRGTVRHRSGRGVRIGRSAQEWRIDERTRATSRTGLAAARATLEAIARRASEHDSDMSAA